LLFFPIALLNAFLGYLYILGAALVLLLYAKKAELPSRLLLILSMPILLRANLAYAVPLGAGMLLSARLGAGLGILSCIAGLAYMVTGNIHHLGPLSVNHVGVPIFIRPLSYEGIGDLFNGQLLVSLISPELGNALEDFVGAIWPALLFPPAIIVQIACWGAAGWAAGRWSRKGTLQHYASGLGAGAAILLLQPFFLWLFPGSFSLSLWPIFIGLLYSSMVVAVLALFSKKFLEPKTDSDVEDVSWNSIGGLEDVKAEIQMVTHHQFDPRYINLAHKFGLRSVKGVLFYGPPGCGKTMFAKVLAKEAKASFFPVKGSDFRSMWYGETDKRLAEVFEKARQHAPSIIFFDEIDNMLGKREETSSSDSPEKQVVAAFLSEMDGVKSLHDVLVVGATNEPDSIDPAALRPGRFDKLIYIPLPDQKGREKIFSVYLRGKPLAEDIHLEKLGKLTERFSGADIADVCSKVSEQAIEETLRTGHVVKITMASLEAQIKSSKPSVPLELLHKYERLREKYGRRTFRSTTDPAEEKKKYSWQQLGGLEDVKQELVEAIETPLRRPEVYERLKITPPKGVLFFGPPGCGKTLIAKVLSSHCSAHFIPVDLTRQTPETIKSWFIRARENKPCILFFDEIDSIALSRDYGPVTNQSVLTQLLEELDGVDELKQVVVIAATNRPDQIDSALMRPGRFDRLIYIPPPDLAARKQILRIHLEGKPLAKDLPLGVIARMTENYSAADLAALCYEVSMCLIRKPYRARFQITMDDFSSALRRIRPSITPEELTHFENLRAIYSRG